MKQFVENILIPLALSIACFLFASVLAGLGFNVADFIKAHAYYSLLLIVASAFCGACIYHVLAFAHHAFDEFKRVVDLRHENDFLTERVTDLEDEVARLKSRIEFAEKTGVPLSLDILFVADREKSYHH